MKTLFVLLFLTSTAWAKDMVEYDCATDSIAGINCKTIDCDDIGNALQGPCLERKKQKDELLCSDPKQATNATCFSVCKDSKNITLGACAELNKPQPPSAPEQPSVSNCVMKDPKTGATVACPEEPKAKPKAVCEKYNAKDEGCIKLCKDEPKNKVCPKVGLQVYKPKPAEVKIETCTWVDDMPRRIVKGPKTSKCPEGANICMGYVACEPLKDGAPKTVRVSTCDPENCHKEDAVDCTKQKGFYSMRPQGEANETLSDNVQKAIGLKE